MQQGDRTAGGRSNAVMWGAEKVLRTWGQGSVELWCMLTMFLTQIISYCSGTYEVLDKMHVSYRYKQIVAYYHQ